MLILINDLKSKLPLVIDDVDINITINQLKDIIQKKYKSNIQNIRTLINNNKLSDNTTITDVVKIYQSYVCDQLALDVETINKINIISMISD